jgi:uncharacterized membrane protein SirB2
MKTYILIRVLLALHLSALTVMAGTTVIDFVTFRTFWEKAEGDGREARGLLPIMLKYGAIVRTSGAILLMSGIAMLTLAHGVWTQQLWFKIKMALVVLLILNGVFIGNRNGTSFREMANEYAPGFINRSADVRTNLNRFYLTQLVLFFAIIMVSALKFDNA